MMSKTLTIETKTTMSNILDRPVYCISDLHMGDGGPRDNFSHNEKQLLSFLDMVQDTKGKLIICGDLFELWQSNISKVITKRVWLLDQLAKMKAIYVLGNHDADLLYFNGWLKHPFFSRMMARHTEQINGKYFHFIHGHQADPYCASDTPGLGRITAIYTGMAEDRHGGPMLNKYRTVEAKVLGPLEKLASLWGRLRGEPDRFTGINRQLRDIQCAAAATIICGHTHQPGRIGKWLYNCGTWAEQTNSYVRIADTVEVFDWVAGLPVPNRTELPI